MDMISLEYLTLENWPRYKRSMVQASRVFSECIRTSQSELFEAFTRENAYGRILTVDDQYVGHALGEPILEDEYVEWELEDYVGVPREELVMFTNFITRSRFRGRGLGKQLFYDMILRAQEKEFTTMIGDFRDNGSFHLAKYFGGEDLWSEEDETGEKYHFCVIDLETF